MSKIKNIIIFGFLPIVIIGLLILNSKVASQRYIAQQEESIRNQYIAQIKSDISSVKLKASEQKNIKVNIKNLGTMTWTKDNNINLSYHILDQNNKVVLEGDRSKLTNSVRQGESTDLWLKLTSPSKIGKYKIELDMVHEGVTWFKEKGSKTYNIELEVTK
ncbi:hypothetical protein [Clostridium sp. DJ247]|uniref:hypothetical protein n=1 Tax=Clostridium sp. DJ247 TaxID=2726188 RepID=UPI001626A855|nr:hypothetical protein [Clostridium sp. DJ247]MBC2581566.1 hypothetical protein [Clostridium sp. DJ247]